MREIKTTSQDAVKRAFKALTALESAMFFKVTASDQEAFRAARCLLLKVIYENGMRLVAGPDGIVRLLVNPTHIANPAPRNFTIYPVPGSEGRGLDHYEVQSTDLQRDLGGPFYKLNDAVACVTSLVAAGAQTE